MPNADPAWLRACGFRPDVHGILTSADGRVGLGAVLIMECSTSRRFLMTRKAFRPGYEMNHRLAFPGGMVRADGSTDSLNECIRVSLRRRVRAEVGIDSRRLGPMLPLTEHPPVVATYSVRGQPVTAAIIAFHATVDAEIPVLATPDPSTYEPRWRELEAIWPEVSHANGLSLAQLVWERLTADEMIRVRPLLTDAARQAIGDAHRAGLPRPFIPWEAGQAPIDNSAM